MMRLLFVCLALAASPQQDPQIPPAEDEFKGTPPSYVIQSKDNITTYQAVSTFFNSLSQKQVQSQAPEFVLGLVAARIGVSRDSAAWQCILDAKSRINAVSHRTVPAERQLALRHDPVAFKQTMGAFQRQQVLDMRREFLKFKSDFEKAGGNMESLMAYIRAWAADHVVIYADAPRDDPTVQEFLAIEELFDTGKRPEGGFQQ
ncbi:MAG: hypothetical protein V3T83_16470 [Acidobacteriota bacterium]